MPAVQLKAIPDDLKEWNQAVLWRFITKRGSSNPDKVPFQPNGKPAASDNPQTWNTFDVVCEAYLAEHWDGVGFVFSADDPFCGIDLDNCLTEKGELKPWAQRIVARFCDSYMEVSPSGRGIKIFVKAKLAGSGWKRPYKDGTIEVYDSGRFFTLTGNVWRGAPSQIEDH